MKDIFLKYITILACAVFLFPIGVSFSHVFDQHEHKTCDNPHDVHFHERTVDCSLYKFQLNPVIEIDIVSFSSESIIIPQETNFSNYSFKLSRALLDISLRGPPQLV